MMQNPALKICMICALIVLVVSSAGAQDIEQDFFNRGRAPETGIIAGTVVDGATGETMVGCAVQVDGTNLGAICDLDGNYRIANVPVGIHVVVASLIGYSDMRITDVEVTGGDVAKLDITLQPEAVDVGEVVVRAEAIRNTEAVLLKDRQKAEAVSDAISAEAISRSGSSSAADAMKQVTGASVVDGGKTVVVRGLGDRYTSVQLNGAEIPSTNPYKRSAPVDLFPTNLLDNIVTVKSFTPDKPGNFSGGTVNIQTKSFPEKFTFSVSASTSHNPQANLTDDFIGGNSGDKDWLGMDDGTRAIPDAVDGQEVPDYGSALNDIGSARLLDRMTRSFNSEMTPSNQKMPVNQSYSASIGNQVDVAGRPLGFLGSLSYSSNYGSYNEGVSANWELTGDMASTNTLTNNYHLSDTRSTDEVLLGSLVKVAYKLTPTNIIGINGIYNQNGESTTRFLEGRFPYDLSESAVYQTSVLQYSERTLKNLQLTGDHMIEHLNGTRIEWMGSVSSAKQDEPDLRYFTNSYTEAQRYDENGDPYMRRFYKIKENQSPRRYYRFMDENHAEAKIDIAVPVEIAERSSTVKFGGLYSSKDRDFDEHLYTFKQNPVYNFDGDPDHLFSEGNVGLIDSTGTPYNIGLFVIDSTTPSSSYTGDQDVSAGYAMIDVPITQALRFIGGVRYETTDMTVASEDSTKDTGRLETDDVLPGINIVYALTGNMNLRASYGKTLARPSFREMAPYASFDFWGGYIFQGNEQLKRTLIDNYDLRWEWFVRPGEIYAISGFAKMFTNPIERVIMNINREITYQNVSEARVLGLELEMRKRLDTFHKRLEHIQLGGNVSFVHSQVDIAPSELALIRAFDPDAESTREFQGQSPYLLNLDVTYDNPDRGINASIFFNTYGERLAEVSLGGTPDVYEQPASTLNLTFAKKMTERLSLKASAKNLLDAEIKKVHEYKGKEYVYSQYKTGRSFSLGLSYSM